MTTIEAWLKEIGLERYLELFQDNDIDPEILPDLTEADFEKLGVSLGHRKKLMRAIAVLADQGTVSARDETPAPAASCFGHWSRGRATAAYGHVL